MADLILREFKTLINRVASDVPGCPYPVILQHIRNAAIDICERSLCWRYRTDPFLLTPEKAEYALVQPIPVQGEEEPEEPEDTDVPEEPEDEEPEPEPEPEPEDPFEPNDPFEPEPEPEPEEPAETSITLADIARAHIILASAISSNEVDYTSMTVSPMHEFFHKYPGFPNGRTGSPRDITQILSNKFCVAPIPDREYMMTLTLCLKPTRDAVGMDADVFEEIEDLMVHGALRTLMVQMEKPWYNEGLAGYHAKTYTFLLNNVRAGVNLGMHRSMLVIRNSGYL